MITLCAVYCFPVTYLFYNCCPYVLILYNYFTCSPISHLWQPLVFPLYLFCYIFPVFIFHIFYTWMKTYSILFFSVWFISFCIISSCCKWQDFILLYGWVAFCCVCVYMYHIFFIHSSVDGYFVCFYVLAIANGAAMNTGVHVSFQIRVLIFSRYMPRSGIAGSYGNSILF